MSFRNGNRLIQIHSKRVLTIISSISFGLIVWNTSFQTSYAYSNNDGTNSTADLASKYLTVIADPSTKTSSAVNQISASKTSELMKVHSTTERDQLITTMSTQGYAVSELPLSRSQIIHLADYVSQEIISVSNNNPVATAAIAVTNNPGSKYTAREISPGRSHYELKEHANFLSIPSISRLIWEAKEVATVYTKASDTSRSKVYLSTIQIVLSKPGSLEQIWHADNKARGITLIIPLVDIHSDDVGTTELLSGTHDLALSGHRLVKPLFSLGEGLWMDSRMIHRGAANRSHESDLPVDRPILVIRFDREETPPPGMGWLGASLVHLLGALLEKIAIEEIQQTPSVSAGNTSSSLSTTNKVSR
jgi:hypothetical protein